MKMFLQKEKENEHFKQTREVNKELESSLSEHIKISIYLWSKFSETARPIFVKNICV